MSAGSLILPKKRYVGDVLTIGATGNLEWVAPGSAGTIGTFFVFNEIPTGAINGVNLSFRTANKFLTGKVQAWLNGVQLIGIGPDKNFIEHVDFQGFTLIISSGPNGLNRAPQQNELMTVAYLRDI